MLLSAIERIQLLQLLPSEGNILTLRTVLEFQLKIGLTEDEQAKVKLATVGDSVSQERLEELAPLEVEIGPSILEIIRNQLKTLESNDKLHISWVPLYERFCESNLHLVEDTKEA
jgi:hypothetical protein